MKHYEPDCRDTYQTGSTQPPKSHQGVIAVLLILITILASVVTVLSMMNIRLFHLLQSQTQQTMAFEPEEQIALVESAPLTADTEDLVPVLGLSCQEIASLYRSYHQLPQGLYISQVESDSTAALAGICPGDILIALNGTPVTNTDSFRQSVSQLPPGSGLTLTIFRDDKEMHISLSVENP